MIKHTSGPFNIMRVADYTVIVDTKYARHLARMVNGAPETEDNARLFAVAPDMRELLQSIVDTSYDGASAEERLNCIRQDAQDVLKRMKDLHVPIAAPATIDWSKPIETVTGIPAQLLYPPDGGPIFVAIQSARLPYNEDGTPLEGKAVYPRLRNVAEQTKSGGPFDALANALDCFWNAALTATHAEQDATANAVMSGMVSGVAAVAERLRSYGDKP